MADNDSASEDQMGDEFTIYDELNYKDGLISGLEQDTAQLQTRIVELHCALHGALDRLDELANAWQQDPAWYRARAGFHVDRWRRTCNIAPGTGHGSGELGWVFPS